MEIHEWCGAALNNQVLITKQKNKHWQSFMPFCGGMNSDAEMEILYYINIYFLRFTYSLSTLHLFYFNSMTIQLHVFYQMSARTGSQPHRHLSRIHRCRWWMCGWMDHLTTISYLEGYIFLIELLILSKHLSQSVNYLIWQ